jgi:hypothetical protein
MSENNPLAALLPQVAKMEIIDASVWDAAEPVNREEPYEGGTGIWLNLVGKDTKVYKDKARQLLKANQGKKSDVFTLLDEGQELTATSIVGWNEVGEEAFGPYTPQRALELVKMDELGPMVEQIQEFTSRRQNFFRKRG